MSPIGSLQFNVDGDVVSRRAREAFRPIFNDIVRYIENNGTAELIAAARLAIENSRTWQELAQQGDLFSLIGDPDLGSKLDEILDLWSSNFRVNVSNARLFRGIIFRASYSVGLVDGTWNDVLALSQAKTKVPSISRGSNGITSIREVELDWLKWLLIDGSKIIVRDYNTTKNPTRSRTGNLVMRRGRSLRIPTQHQGTPRNNFVTRALDTIDVYPLLEKILGDAINAAT